MDVLILAVQMEIVGDFGTGCPRQACSKRSDRGASDVGTRASSVFWLFQLLLSNILRLAQEELHEIRYTWPASVS